MKWRIVATILTAVPLVQGESGAFPVFGVFALMSVVNFKQALRFFDKTKRKYEGKYIHAMKVLTYNLANDNQKKNAINTLIECANGGYEPAKVVLSQIMQQNQ